MATVLFVVVIVAVATHALALFVTGRRSIAIERGAHHNSAHDLFFVFVVPCLNEELVIERTVRSLLEWKGAQFAVLVVDDASDDGTAAVVRAIGDSRVFLHQRRLPHARRGKGDCLNAGLEALLRHPQIAAHRNDRVIVSVIDADGRIDPDAYRHVAPHFTQPNVAGLQIRVRIHNAADAVLARLQQMEFDLYTSLFQRGRSRLGTASLGGNGQFVRLSALMELRPSWSDCLTEDLDLGIRLLLRGHRLVYEPGTWVSQQGVVSATRLLRQRTRWFQGHLQCWRHIPTIRSSRMSTAARFDLIYHVLSPALVLGVSLVVFAIWAAAVVQLASGRGPGASVVQILLSYAFAFGAAPLLAAAQRSADESAGRVRSLAWAHVYLLYTLLWSLAGWRAIGRIALRRGGWTKTDRTTGTGDSDTHHALPPLALPRRPAPGRAASRRAA